MKHHSMFATAFLILFGMGVAHAAKRVEATTYRAQDKEAAGKVLLQKSLVLAADGSWERIAVGRAYYLAGMKSEGQAIFDAVLASNDNGDLFRVARVYREAGEWPRAKALFDKALLAEPNDEKGLAEVGAYYLLEGDRETAEVLFDRSFKLEPDMWATLAAAGAYLGVKPQE